MKLLFITLLDIRSVDEHNIYADLIREFARHGHDIYILSPIERRYGMKTQIIENNHVHILKLKTGNIQKTNIIEKGISTLLLEYQLTLGIKKYLQNVSFDLVLYSTPPITLVKPIKYIRKRDNAKTYLMLKDIFPQNAIDLEMMTITGLKGILYRYFRKKEKMLYAISDCIGCTSQANIDFVLNHNSDIHKDKVKLCPNCIEARDLRLNEEERNEMRKKYDIPLNKTVFVYGGNLGKPQDIPFVIECLKKALKYDDNFFLVVGDGTEYGKLASFVDTEKPKNVKLMKRLPKEDYDRMIAACDVGLIFLDHRFTIPNSPSRLLSYMQVGIPTLACTDSNTDIGKEIVEGGFGWWCESNDADYFSDMIAKINKNDLNTMGIKAYKYLTNVYCVSKQYTTIVSMVDLTSK